VDAAAEGRGDAPSSLLIILLQVWSVTVVNTLSIHLNTLLFHLTRNVFCPSVACSNLFLRCMSYVQPTPSNCQK
jgi:hypothetical protein